jgi:hypothetical protein
MAKCLMTKLSTGITFPDVLIVQAICHKSIFMFIYIKECSALGGYKSNFVEGSEANESYLSLTFFRFFFIYFRKNPREFLVLY